MGWHLYLRDNIEKQCPNADGYWGWIRWRGKRDGAHPFQSILNALGISIRGDGTCNDDGYAEIAKRFPIPRHRIGGKPRGCIEIKQSDGSTWHIVQQRTRINK